jgi:hypothetical protein
MDEKVIGYVMDRLANASINLDPFDHFYIKDIFPEDFYQEILSNIPDGVSYTKLSETGKVDARTYPIALSDQTSFS